METNLSLNIAPIGALDSQNVSGHGVGALGILGKSGEGKSTLLKAMAGLIGDANDQFTLFDYNWKVSDTFNPCVYVNQTLGLFSHWSVADNLEKTAKHARPFVTNADETPTVSDIVTDLKLTPLLNKPVELLSLGETQRVLIARAMLSKKPILLLDEILSGLDSSMRQFVMTKFQKWHKKYNRKYVVVSHDLADLSFLCGQALIVSTGKISYFACMQVALCEYEKNPETYFSKLKVKYLETQKELGVHLYSTATGTQRVYKRISQSSLLPAHDVNQIIIPASQVSICADPDINISMLNNLTGTITHIQVFDNHVLISIDIDGQIIQSVISHKSLVSMQLKPTQSIAVIFKAI